MADKIDKIDKEEVIKKVKAFPSMSGTAMRLLGLLEDPKTNVAEIESALKYEPSLTANILKLTNSAYFGLPRQVGSISQAVSLLGTKKLIQLILATCVSAVMDKPVPGYDLSSEDLRRHCIAVSVVAEDILRELKQEVKSEVFTAALLHDIGKLVLGNFLKDKPDIINQMLVKEVSFEIAEKEILGTDHAEIGALILEQWSFPKDIVAAVRFHHNPELSPKADSLIDVVHIANMLCLMLGIGGGKIGLSYQPSSLAIKRLGLKSHHIEIVASRIMQWVNELSEIFKSY